MQSIWSTDMQHLCLFAYTIVLMIWAIMYGIYMIISVNKNINVKADERTYRLAFFVVIVVTIAFLALGFGKEIKSELLAVLGTIAGYVLGGVTPARVTHHNWAEETNQSGEDGS